MSIVLKCKECGAESEVHASWATPRREVIDAELDFVRVHRGCGKPKPPEPGATRLGEPWSGPMPQTDHITAASIGQTAIDAAIKCDLVRRKADGLYGWPAHVYKQVGQAVSERHVAPLVAERDAIRFAIDCLAYGATCERFQRDGVPCYRHAEAELRRERDAALSALRDVVEAADRVHALGGWDIPQPGPPDFDLDRWMEAHDAFELAVIRHRALLTGVATATSEQQAATTEAP